LECRNQFFGCEKIPFVVVFVRKEGKIPLKECQQQQQQQQQQLFIQSDFLPTVLKRCSRSANTHLISLPNVEST
jgi:hypothetical protein